MGTARYFSINQLVKLIHRPSFWLILILLIVITLPHYHEVFKHPTFISQMVTNLGLDRHAFERSLCLAPIVWAGFLFGWKGAVITSLATLALMLPRAFFFSQYPMDALFEISAVFIIGNVLAVSFNALRKEREYRTELEIAQQELESNIQTIRENEKRLAGLNQVSSTVSQSLELSQVLNSAVDNVMNVMQVDIAWIYLLDDEAGELIMTTHRGVPAEVVKGMDKLKVGEGLNGWVAQSGEPLFVEDASQDSRLTRDIVSKHNIHSALIVPLSSKGKVNGTLCIAMYSHRVFQQEEIELLAAVGNQIGVAVDNARLYQQQQEAAEELRTSEERFRELFENAHDAIWIHNLDGNVIAANKAAAKLSGYNLGELMSTNVKSLLSDESLNLARQIRSKLLNNEPIEQPYEQRIIRKDGNEATVQLSTSLVLNKGEPAAFQHIARDITEQKRMQENLRFYLRQTTNAQEEERKRISHELHDETIQALVVLSRQLDALASSKNDVSEEQRLHLEELWQQTNVIIRGVRRLSQDLRPAALDRLGLLSALEWLASDTSEYSGIATKVNLLGTERRLPEEVELVLFRITQEALRNVWRHSQATRAEITVEFNSGKTKITVSDNGKGFNLPEKIGDLARDGKLGLTGMQERAQLIGGNLSVQSQPGKGTSVTMELSS